MGAREDMNVKFHRITSYTWNFQNFTCVITILVKFDIHFLGLPWEIFIAVATDDLLHLKHLKNVKKNVQTLTTRACNGTQANMPKNVGSVKTWSAKIKKECLKKNAIFFKLFWYKIFNHWKLKLLSFLVDSVLNPFPSIWTSYNESGRFTSRFCIKFIP